jgi:hypothetical protein
MRFRYLVAFVCLLALSGKSHAKIWGDYIASGSSCNSGNTSVIENGDTVSILFDDFGVNMPQQSTGDGLTTRKTCNFRIQLNPPSGFYLAGFRQLYSGGIIKSARSSAQLTVRYNIGSVGGRPLPIEFPRGQAISPSSPNSSYSRTFNDNLLVANCGGSTTYGINMQFTGVRDSYDRDFLIGGLDSVDASFVQKLVLIPEWRLCR